MFWGFSWQEELKIISEQLPKGRTAGSALVLVHTGLQFEEPQESTQLGDYALSVPQLHMNNPKHKLLSCCCCL